MNSLGFGSTGLPRPAPGGVEHVAVRSPLDRILAFTGYSIEDVVNGQIAKNAVLGYYKVQNQVRRACEVVDLERQWNSPVPRRASR